MIGSGGGAPSQHQSNTNNNSVSRPMMMQAATSSISRPAQPVNASLNNASQASKAAPAKSNLMANLDDLEDLN